VQIHLLNLIRATRYIQKRACSTEHETNTRKHQDILKENTYNQTTILKAENMTKN